MEIVWNAPGQRRFEVGCDRGVFYPKQGAGVGWNGLVSVTQKTSETEPRAYYMDGEKYLNQAARTDFSGILEAFYFPDKFAAYAGFVETNGFGLDSQPKREFHMSYRTLLGDDIEGTERGYRIHLLYNVLALPADVKYPSLTNQTSLQVLSWSLTTRPLRVQGYSPTAHYTINSTKVDPQMLKVVESYLYGTATTPPQILQPQEWFDLLGDSVFEVVRNTDTGYWDLVDGENPDVVGNPNRGLYTVPPSSRLKEVDSGFYTLE